MFWNAAKELIGFVVIAAFAIPALAFIGGALWAVFGS